MDAATIAAAAAALFLACGVSSDANYTSNTTTSSPETVVTSTTGSSVSTNQISTTLADEGINAGEIAAAVVVPLVVVIGVALAVYFLWFRHWLQQCRQNQLDDRQGQDKEQIDATAAGDSAHGGQLRYSKNPRKQHQQQTESVTPDYAAVDRQSISSNDDCGSDVDYENFAPPRAAAKEESHETYENIRSEPSAPAAKKVMTKKKTAGATGDKKKAGKLPGPTEKDAVPDYRAPVPPPQDGSGGSSSLSPAASTEVDSSEQDAHTATYVKLVGIASAKQQPAKTKVPPQVGPKNLPRSSQASGNAPYSSNLQQRQQSPKGTSAGTDAAVGKPSKGHVPTVALRPLGRSNTDDSESETTEDDTYVGPDAGAADHAAPPSKQPPSAATSEDGTDLYVEPQGDDVYENYQ